MPSDWYCSLELIKVEYFTQICAQNAAKVFPLGAVYSMLDLSFVMSQLLESTDKQFIDPHVLYIQNMDFCVWSVIKLIPSTEDKL